MSVARNTGIENAKSEYITFVDSDDWLEPKSFKQIVNIIKKDKPEVVLTGFYDVYDREWVKGVHGEEVAKEVEIESKFRNKNLDNLAIFESRPILYTKDGFLSSIMFAIFFATYIGLSAFNEFF